MIRLDDVLIYHVTWGTHNVRVSERMIEYNVKRGDPENLELEEEIVVAEELVRIIRKDKIRCLALNICKNHVHFLVLVGSIKELTDIVRKVKSCSSRKLHLWQGVTVPLAKQADSGACPNAKEGKKSRGHTQNILWARRFGRGRVESLTHLQNAISYIKNNRAHHQLYDDPRLRHLAYLAVDQEITSDLLL